MGRDGPQRGVTDYLKRVRAEPDHLVIVTGATRGLTLLVRLLDETGHTILAVESPSNASQRRVLGRHISHILDVPVRTLSCSRRGR